VIVALEWPSTSATTFVSTPASSATVANVWRRPWGDK